MQMPLSPSWTDIIVRLALAMIAGAVLGLNRGARGHAAGLRTTILVTLAAAAAMIQCNILLTLDGKQPGFFAVMDLMRLPLGILTGVGFIGGGAILKKGGSITGVTTAATLWIATVIGLLSWRRAARTWDRLDGARAVHALGNALDRHSHPARAQRDAGCRDRTWIANPSA